MDHTSTNAPSIKPDDSVDVINNLLPALVQCFSAILLGYLAAKFGVLNSTHAKGLGIYLSKFALPALFLKVIIGIHLNDVNWLLVGAVSLGKVLVFFLVSLFTIILTRPTNMGMAGILSIFATLSNDVALGFPILDPLYPNLAKYIYLFAPAQIILLTPASFLFLEWHAQHSTQSQSHQPIPRREKLKRLLKVFRDVLLNPLIASTFLGIIFNFIFHQRLPHTLDLILSNLGSTFAATSQFYLGYHMVGKMADLDRKGIYILTFILLAKQIFTPFATRQLVSFITYSQINDSSSLTTFSFLYGAVPTAPPVFLYATQYNMIPEVIAAGLVVGTFLSGPLMYISARMVTISVASVAQFDNIITSTSFSISVLSLLGSIWVIILFVLTRRVCRIPQLFTFVFVCMTSMTCIGLLIGNSMHKPIYYKVERFNNHASENSSSLSDVRIKWVRSKDFAKWPHYVQFVVYFLGVTSTRIWTMLLAMTMALLKIRSLCFVLRHKIWIWIAGICIPTAITGFLVILASNEHVSDIDPVFPYGKHQLVVSTCVLIVSIFGTIFFLVLMLRYHNHKLDNEEADMMEILHLSQLDVDLSDKEDDKSTTLDLNDSCTSDKPLSKYPSANNGDSSPIIQSSSDLDIEKWMAQRVCPRDFSSPEQKRENIKLLAQYRRRLSRSILWPQSNGNAIDFAEQLDSECQTHRHMVLLILLLITMFFGLFLCIWRLIQDRVTGIYIELEFLDTVFNFGQGLIAFAIFGLDTQFIVIPFKKQINKFLFGEEIVLPREEFLDCATKRVRYQFSKHHLKLCLSDIATNRRYRLVSYPNSFYGSSLIDWLLNVGLVQDRVEGLTYGQKLLCSRVIHHVTRRHNYHDNNDLYQFDEEFLDANPDTDTNFSDHEVE